MADYTKQLLNFRNKMLFHLTNNSLGNIKSKCKRQSLITSMFTVLNIFIKKRVTAKSRDLVSALLRESPYRVKLGDIWF